MDITVPPSGDMYFDETNYSFTNLVTPELARAMKSPEVTTLLYKGEDYIRQKLDPTPAMYRIRTAWWMEYDKCLQEMKSCHSIHPDRGLRFLKRVASSTCSLEYLSIMLENPNFLAWMLTPITDYQVAVEEALTSSVNKMREILTQPILQEKRTRDGDTVYDSRGEPVMQIDHQTANLFLQIMTYLDKRVRGATPEKLYVRNETKVLNQYDGKGNARTTPVNVTASHHTMSIEDVERRLQAIGTPTDDMVAISAGKHDY